MVGIWNLLFVLVVLVSTSEASSSRKLSNLIINYRGAQVLRVKVTKAAQRSEIMQMLQDQLFDMWMNPADEQHFVDIMVLASNLNYLKSKLKSMLSAYKVLIADVHAAIKAEKNVSDDNQKLMKFMQETSGHNLTWLTYHRLADIYGYLDYLAQTFPKLCSVCIIGNSSEGRPIKLIRITSSPEAANSSFFIEGGIHGREWITTASVTYIIRELVENRQNHPWASKVDFAIVPVLNPDGYEFTHTNNRLWRKSRSNATYLGRCTGTDLNRNFGYKWGGMGSSINPCHQIYAGAGAFSEPESQALRCYLTRIRKNIKAYVSFHSYGQSILLPYTYEVGGPLAPDYNDLERIATNAAEKMKSSNGSNYKVGNAAKLLFPAAGIHAREWISPASVTYVIKELVENRSRNAWANNIEFNIVPVLNPDGYEYTHTTDRLWRKNRRNPELGECAGTDLNRNFEYKWSGQGASSNPCSEIYYGTTAFSEPESQALKNYLTSKNDTAIKAYITFHSYGQAILYPWGYDKKAPQAPDTKDLLRVGKKMAADIKKVKGGGSYIVGNSAKAYYAAAGTSDDWFKAVPKAKFSYTVELRDKGRYGFVLPASEILPAGKDALEAIKTLASEISKKK